MRDGIVASGVALALLIGAGALVIGRHHTETVFPAVVPTGAHSGHTEWQIPASADRRVLVLTNTHQTARRTVTVRSVPTAQRRMVLEHLPNCSGAAENQGTPITPAGSRKQPPPQRSFTVSTGTGPLQDARFMTTVSAPLAGWNTSVAVYRHPDARIPTADRLHRLLGTFRRQAPQVARLLGSGADDVDHDNRFTILITPRTPGRESPRAYVRPADFQTSAPLSNRADMMYLADDFPDSQHLDTLLAHEYTHAVCCGLRPGTPEEDWVSEGLAHSVEYSVGASLQNLDHRLARFLNTPERFPLAVPDYYAAGLFREHGCRGATASFFAHSCQTAGPWLPRVLARSARTGRESVSSAMHQRFEDAMEAWAIGLLSTLSPSPPQHLEPRVRGRFVDIGPRVHQWDGGSSMTVDIAPTAAAFIEISDPNTKAIDIPCYPGLRHRLIRIPRGPAFAMNAAMRDGELTISTESSGPGGGQISIGIETTNGRRSESIGVYRRELSAGSDTIVVPITVPTGPVTIIKSFVRFDTGEFATARREPGTGRQLITQRTPGEHR